MLSALFVRYRDVAPIWEVALQICFYGAPILYPIEKIPNVNLQHLIMCNPLAVIVEQARHAIVDPTAPSAAQAIGGAVYLLIPFGLTVLVCVLGYVIFDRSAPHIAEEL
jgi:ABC-2 type transport system permease protein